MNIHDFLIEHNACKPSIKWASSKNLDEIWNTCKRGDWLLWLAQKCKVDARTLTAAKAKCAALGLPYMTDQRSIDAIEAARKFGRGEISNEDLETFAHFAYFAFDDAENSENWDKFAAAYCAYSASCISADAFNAAIFDFASKSTQKRAELSLICADIVRETIPFDHIKQFINNY